MNNKVLGNLGENIAEKYLKKYGYSIIEKNFRCAIGEIDIIAINKNSLVFVEVKTRTSTKFGYPKEAVNYYKKNKIIKVAETFITYHKNYINYMFRFDVIEVLIDPNSFKLNKLNHIKNAFTL
ncbi:YraN family protein [Thermoanaerobacterium sp. RBIITD]|uniref:YraN family protein n=1 Tax=Thermoanaerobacterium sp. RBIITD TaxID=1550240 RepID=UPI000BB98C26|nr:YraN family protein [Thermoanaerobacterium sp. RBIITD]SNX55533.1 putative endonuclease [Thermoanaerobacterium sp. RBIITD]